jgi:hypothetical protein
MKNIKGSDLPEEEEQIMSLVVGRRVEKCVLAQAHQWGGRWT